MQRAPAGSALVKSKPALPQRHTSGTVVMYKRAASGGGHRKLLYAPPSEQSS